MSPVSRKSFESPKVRREHRRSRESWSFLCFLRKGELVYGQSTPRRDFIDNADEAIERLLRGEAIWIKMYGPLVTQMQQTIRGRVLA
jgi:hypothetical protein